MLIHGATKVMSTEYSVLYHTTRYECIFLHFRQLYPVFAHAAIFQILVEASSLITHSHPATNTAKPVATLKIVNNTIRVAGT